MKRHGNIVTGMSMKTSYRPLIEISLLEIIYEMLRSLGKLRVVRSSAHGKGEMMHM